MALNILYLLVVDQLGNHFIECLSTVTNALVKPYPIRKLVSLCLSEFILSEVLITATAHSHRLDTNSCLIMVSP